MVFEWDEAKRLSNIEKHGVDFLDATQLFDGRPVFTYYSPRNEEDRWSSVGLLEVDAEEDFYLVVWARRETAVRIIAAYRADDWEIREHGKLYG